MNWFQLVAFVCGANFNTSLPRQILEVSSEFEVSETLVLSVVHTESRCNPNALGSSNDTGLMQIVPKWHQDRIKNLEVDNLFDPYQNMRVGVSLLKALDVNNNAIDALVVYNGGYRRPQVSYAYANKVLLKSNTYEELLTTR